MTSAAKALALKDMAHSLVCSALAGGTTQGMTANAMKCTCARTVFSERSQVSGLRRERMVNDLFNDEAEDLSSFGRVARDDFFNDDH